MTSIDVVVTQLSPLERQDLERWISNRWVRPDKRHGGFNFQAIDIARVRLIKELRDDLQVNEEALPIVLSLLDQLYELRRRVRELGVAIERVAPDEIRRTLMQHLANPAR